MFHDVSAAVVYDVLHDQEYRSKWDKYSLEVKDIGHLNPNNLIGYFACKCIFTFTFSIFLTEFNVFLAKKVTQKAHKCIFFFYVKSRQYVPPYDVHMIHLCTVADTKMAYR